MTEARGLFQRSRLSDESLGVARLDGSETTSHSEEEDESQQFIKYPQESTGQSLERETIFGIPFGFNKYPQSVSSADVDEETALFSGDFADEASARATIDDQFSIDHSKNGLDALHSALSTDEMLEGLYSGQQILGSVSPNRYSKGAQDGGGVGGSVSNNEKATVSAVSDSDLAMDPHRAWLLEEKGAAINRLESMGYDPFTGLYAAHRPELMKDKTKLIRVLESMGYDPKTGLYAAHRDALMRDRSKIIKKMEGMGYDIQGRYAEHRPYLMEDKQKAIQRLQATGHDEKGMYAAHRENAMKDKMKVIERLRSLGIDPTTGKKL